MPTREDSVVRMLLKARTLAVIVMDGVHDLSNNADQISNGRCEVITDSLASISFVAMDEFLTSGFAEGVIDHSYDRFILL